MLNELLKEVVSIAVGKSVEDIAELLNSQKYVNEFTIAKKLGITINQTRNILYKISDHSLVIHERQKDKKKGWYTYYWKFDVLKCLEFLKEKVLESREKFETQILRREEKQYYVCESCNLEHSEDEALLMEFTCDECGELLTLKDNSVLLKGLKKNLEKIDEKLAIIDIEIKKERDKLNKKKEKVMKQVEKEIEDKKEAAKQKRAEKRAQLKKEREAEGIVSKKKVVKKVSEKKAVKKVSEKKVAKKAVKKVSEKKVALKKIAKKVVLKPVKVIDRKAIAIKKVAERKIVKKKALSSAVKNVVKRLAAKKKNAAKKK